LKADSPVVSRHNLRFPLIPRALFFRPRVVNTAKKTMIKKSLAPLALGGFGIGMTEFVMMGILPDIATGLNISIPQAGYLISAYAVGVVVGAPTLVSMLSHKPPRTVLIWFMLMFTAFNALSAFAPNFHTMLLFRFLAGLPHGAFFGVGAVVATRLADKGKEAAALASMFSGLTIANVLGVPAGTWLGHNMSWRFVFLIVAVIGLATMIMLHKQIPYFEATWSRYSLNWSAGRFFERRSSCSSICTTASFRKVAGPARKETGSISASSAQAPGSGFAPFGTLPERQPSSRSSL